MLSRSLPVALIAAASCAVLGACSNQPADAQPQQSAQSRPEQSQPVVQEAKAPQPGQPVVGPTAVRVLAVSSGTAAGVRLSVVGPDLSTYRLRIGKQVTSCKQANGKKAARALPGLPPNAVNPAVLTCPGPSKQAVVQSGVLLIRTDVGDGFNYDYEVPVSRDL